MPVKQKLFYFLVWNLNWKWNWNWDWRWNDLTECQKLWRGLCILHWSYKGDFAPRISKVQNTQAWVFDTPSSHSNFHPSSNSNSNLNSKLKDKKVFFIFHGDRPNTGVDSEDSDPRLLLPNSCRCPFWLNPSPELWQLKNQMLHFHLKQHHIPLTQHTEIWKGCCAPFTIGKS